MILQAEEKEEKCATHNDYKITVGRILEGATFSRECYAPFLIPSDLNVNRAISLIIFALTNPNFNYKLNTFISPIKCQLKFYY